MNADTAMVTDSRPILYNNNFKRNAFIAKKEKLANSYLCKGGLKSRSDNFEKNKGMYDI